MLGAHWIAKPLSPLSVPSTSHQPKLQRITTNFGVIQYVPKQTNPSTKPPAPRSATEPSKAGLRPIHHSSPTQYQSPRTPSPASQDTPTPRVPAPSTISAALTNSPAVDYLSASPTPRTSIQGSPSSFRSSSPASMVGSFAPFSDSSPTELPYHTQHMQDRFPFNPETHSAPAIRG
jgi:hypothetical protein